MPNYHIWTMGCQMNQADSIMAAKLEGLGYAGPRRMMPTRRHKLMSCAGARQGRQPPQLLKASSAGNPRPP
jgi:hypothetical protein